MQHAKRKRKRKDVKESSSDEEIIREREDSFEPETKADERKEVTFLEPPMAEVTIGLTENITRGAHNISESYVNLPEMNVFVTAMRPKSGVKVRLNLPKLEVPNLMMWPEEQGMRDLQGLLLDIGYEVHDRGTLAFFAIGGGLNVRSAARYFINFYKLLNTEEFKSPNRARMDRIESDILIEGFTQHGDGTFGPLLNLQKWNVLNHTVQYICRELVCYLFSMVDLSLLRQGITEVINAQNMTKKSFAPYQKAKIQNTMSSCVPLQWKGRFMINPCVYATLVYRVVKPLLASRIKNFTLLLSLDEFREKYPHLVLPPSVFEPENSTCIKHLSVDEQLDFKFFLE